MDAQPVSPYSLISSAIEGSNCLEIQLLMKRYPDVANIQPHPFGSWLHYAAGYGSLEAVKCLLSMKFDVNTCDVFDKTNPLNSAAMNDRPDIVKFLLEEGAELDTSASIRNPLFVGSMTGPRSLEVVRLLLAAGIDSKVRYNTDTMDGYDAVAFALEAGHIECAQMIALWNADGDIDAANAAMIEAQLAVRRNNKMDDIIPDELLIAMRITVSDWDKLCVERHHAN